MRDAYNPWAALMELPKNIFKAQLASGETQYGLWLGIPDNNAAEIVAGAGFDWLVIDGEHAAFDLRAMLAHLQAMAPYPVAPIIRAVDGDPALLKQLLDIGAQTLLIPMVDDADSAAELVQAVRYPPEGIRGVGTSLARAARWNAVPGYLQHANEQICLIVQAESVTALENISAIADVDGVDAVFIGPSDLAASMGYVGNPGHPEVTRSIEAGIKAVRAAGKQAGLLALDPAMARHFIKLGASFVGVGVDTLILGNGARALAKSFRDPDDGEAGPSGAGY